MKKTDKIYIAGHNGLVGSAILKHLKAKGYTNFVCFSHDELDLTNQIKVEQMFAKEKLDYVVLAAAKVGGIMANNTYRADFIYENLQIQNNIIHSAYLHGVKKLLFLGSSCIYPKNAKQPIKEEYLLTDELEYTNEPYAIAKIAGLKMCESYNLQYGTNFISVMPTNLYGNNDNFDLEKSHVMPALIRKMHLAKLLSENKFDEVCKDLGVANINEAREYLAKFGVNENSVEIWGSGKPLREFLHVDDMAAASVFVLENVDFKDICGNGEIKNTHINVGFGSDISIKDLAYMIKDIVGFSGDIVFNATKPNGTMKKLMDSSKLNKLGFIPKISLEEGIKSVYKNYKEKF